MLQDIASALCAGLRSGYYCARLGGDEFVLLLLHLKQDDACHFVERMRTHLKNVTISFGDGIGISVGLASVTADASIRTQTLLTLADQSMYAQKYSARDGNHF